MKTKLISKHHKNPLAGHFEIKKTPDFVAWRYYLPTLQDDFDTYVKGYNMCPTFKAVHHKLYSNLKSLGVFMYYWKNLSMNFIIGLLISIN